MSTVNTVIFDVDETLLYEHETEATAFRDACTELTASRADSDALLAAIEDSARNEWDRSPCLAYANDVAISFREGLWGEFAERTDGIDAASRQALLALAEWVPGYRIRSWTSALLAAGVAGVDPTAAVTTCIRHRSRHHRSFPDALPALELLGGRYRLGVLTNGAPGVQWAKIDGAGIGDLFDAVVVSGDVGHGKPHRAGFDRVLDLVGAIAPNAVMVGDSIGSDIEGAQSVGMRGILVNRSGRDVAVNEGVPVITTLEGLPTAIERVIRAG